MNLTYKATETGYTILLDGKPWIVQDKDVYIPFPAATMEESAELHIADIIRMNTPPENPPVTTEGLQEQLADLAVETDYRLSLSELGLV